MKYFLILGATALISLINCVPHPPHHLSEEMKKNMDECRTELGTTKEEERELHRKHDLQNDKIRCMPACLLKKDGVFQENKQLNVDAFYEKLHKFTSVTEDVKKTIENCSNEAKNEKDDCEFARNFMHCSHKAVGHHPGHPPGHHPGHDQGRHILLSILGR